MAAAAAFAAHRGLSRCIHVIEDGHLTLVNMRLVNGVARWGGGILVEDNSEVILRSSRITDCHAFANDQNYLPGTAGGGIRVASGHVTLYDSAISRCTSSGVPFWGVNAGGGLAVGTISGVVSGVLRVSAHLYRSHIEDCHVISEVEGVAAMGGGAHLAADNAELRLEDSAISGCSVRAYGARASGGAIAVGGYFIDSIDVRLLRSNLTHNYAEARASPSDRATKGGNVARGGGLMSIPSVDGGSHNLNFELIDSRVANCSAFGVGLDAYGGGPFLARAVPSRSSSTRLSKAA